MNRYTTSNPWIFSAALVVVCGAVAVADAAPRLRRPQSANSSFPAANSTPTHSGNRATIRRRPAQATFQPGRGNNGITLDIRPNVSSTRPRPRPTRPPNLLPNPPSVRPRPGGIVTSPRPQPPRPQPTRPTAPPSFVPPTRVPTPPPVVTTPQPPQRPRPSVTFPDANKVPQRPIVNANKPLVIVAEDVEEKLPTRKPLGKLPPKFGKDGVPLDEALADKLNNEFKEPSEEAAEALKELFGPTFKDKLTAGELDALINSDLGKQFKLGEQWKVKAAGGDVALALGLHKKLLAAGGWKHAPCLGPIGPGFVTGCFGAPYCGPCYFPTHCWFPNFCGWVNWGCWNTCHWYWNPLPYWCHPMACHPCGPWNFWHCPAWIDWHLVACGTWWNVPVVHVHPNKNDLQALAVRFVGQELAEEKLGPTYRVFIRNNSPHHIVRDFNVMIFAGNDKILSDTLPQVGARVKSIAPGEVRAVDLRLPAMANGMRIDEHGRAVPFEYLHVLVDSHREIPEVFENNNGAILERTKILPVDPSAFAIDTNIASAEEEVTIAGEGFGGMPGKVVVFIGDLSFDAEISGWYDFAARVKLPEIPLASATDAEVVVMRRDGAAANPLTLRLFPGPAVSALVPPKP